MRVLVVEDEPKMAGLVRRALERDGPPTLVIVGNNDAPRLQDAYIYIAAMNRVGQSNQVVIVPGAHEVNVWRAGLSRCVPFLLAGNP